MLPAALLALHSPLPASRINELVKARDFDRLHALLEMPLPMHENDPFIVLKEGGAYEVGKGGWTATDLDSVVEGEPGYVVIGAALTSEDSGQLLFQRDGDKLRFIPEDDPMGVRITDHNFVVVFHPQTKQVRITDTVSFHATTKGRKFVFRMSPQYHVDRVKSGDGAFVSFSQTQGVVVVRRSSASDFRYTIDYSATVNQPGFAGSISETEATLTNDYWYPMIARYPAPYQAEIHAPLGWTPLAQGEKVMQEDRGTETVARYRMDLPVTYYSLSAAPYKTFSQVIGGRRISVWSLRMNEEQMREQTEFYAPILKFYEQFSPFPFSGYGAVDSAVYGGGALEAYSFATYGGGLPYEDAHEPSHTWWGGIMDNTYLSSFWNESFADFCDGLYHRNAPIGDVNERRFAFVQPAGGSADFDRVAILGAGVSAGRVAGSLGYGKGALVLQMLEQLVGTPKTIQIMHDWIAVHEKGTPADWPEFEQVAEQDAPDQKLASFFADWLARPGYAHLGAQVSYGGGATEIDLQWNGPRFRMPLLVLLRPPTGPDLYKLLDTADGDHFKIAGSKPAMVSIDPFRQALRDLGDNERPPTLASVQTSVTLADPAHPDWNLAASGGTAPNQAPADLAGAFVVGSPETLPWMKPLCDKVGFEVNGSSLTYKGTTIDLEHGCAQAVVDLGSGRTCKISLGKTRHAPDFGEAHLALSDDLGRFLRGETSPKTSGKLTYRL